MKILLIFSFLLLVGCANTKCIQGTVGSGNILYGPISISGKNLTYQSIGQQCKDVTNPFHHEDGTVDLNEQMEEE